MVSQGAFPPSARKLSPPADVKREVTLVQAASTDRAPETTGRAVRVTNFDVARHRYEDVLLRANKINDSVMALRDISNTRDFSLLKSFLHFADHARRILSITTTVAVSP